MRPARTSLALLLLLGAARADDWPQWMGPRRDAVWREGGLLDRFPKGGPKVLWRVNIGGGYAGPAVADGKVYVPDRLLDAGQADPANPFARTKSAGKERLLCLDAATGKEIWKHEYPSRYTMSYPCGPRATPAVSGGKVYHLGAMGDLYCLDAKKGKVVWSKDFKKDYDAGVPVWGFSASPLVDGQQLICLVGKDPVVVAFDKDTGKELWRALTLEQAKSEVGYCPPMIYTFGGRRHLVVWHPEAVVGLDPASGKELWRNEWEINANLSIPTPRQVGDRLFVTSFYNGCKLLQIEGAGDKFTASEVWQSHGRGERPGQTDKLHAIMSTPTVKDGHVYGVCSYGELRCLSLADGKRLWAELTASGAGKEPERWANAFLIEQGGRFFLFNEKGELIIANLTPKGYEEIGRAKLLEPTGQLAAGFSSPRKVVWSHPAFANKCCFARNDKEIVCVSLAAP
ncbi:MAG: PQQ-binding-like beta-propeller repeat protein [Gemmataceae bacterium]